MSTVRSRKNKGKRLQNYTRDVILETFKNLESDDVISAIMGESGVDIKLSPAARKVFPYSIENKNCEKLDIYKAIEQAETNAKENTVPVVVFKKNFSDIYISIPFQHFIELVKIVKNISENNNENK